MPENWAIDPVHCVQREEPWRQPCPVLTSRNEAMSRPTPVKYDQSERGSRTWRAGIALVRQATSRRTGKPGDTFRLSLHDDEGNSTTSPPLTRRDMLLASDVLRAAQAGDGTFECAGMSILEMVWAELDSVMDRLMSTPAADGRDPGRAEAFAMVIAIFNNPYRPNIEAVKQQAMDRWEATEDA